MTYQPLDISAVNHSTGVFTCTAHGLVTGGGFAAFPRGPSWGGALFAPAGGIIPTGLSPAPSTYWPIRTDNDHFKLAASNADAMAGTSVSFSTDGALPLSFLIGLPFEVPRISAPLTQIRPDDDNTAWQSLKALHAVLTGQSQSIWTARLFQRTIIGAAGIEQVPDNTKVQRVGPQLRFSATRTGSNGVLYPLLDLPVGALLRTMKIVYDRAGNTLAFSIVAQDLDTGASTSGAQILVNDSSSSGVQAPTVNLFAGDGSGHPTGAAGTLEVRADRAYWVLCECTYTSGTPIVYGLSINP